MQSKTPASRSHDKKRGILLVTTLLIVALLTALTLGFIEINRDSLLFAQKVNESEGALQAAYAGVHYAMMRFEQDPNFGYASNLTQNTINTSTVQHDAFPDGTPGGYGTAGTYWSGSGYVIPFNASNFTIYETGNTVVGQLANNESHFQIHFNHFAAAACPNNTGAGYSSNGFDDNAISTASFADWSHQQIAPELHSCNNLNSSVPITVGGKIVPSYSAHIISTGYSHGVTRTVEAMLKRVFFSNSSLLAGTDININLLYNTSPATFASLAPNWNNIEAGASYTGGAFQQTGGSINFTGPNYDAIDPAYINFNSSASHDAGKAYALRSPGAAMDNNPPGIITNLNGNTYPLANGINFVTVGGTAGQSGSGTLYAKADNLINLPPKDLNGSDILNMVNANPALDSSGNLFVPQNNPCWISPGSYFFYSDGGKGNLIASPGNAPAGSVPCIGSSVVLPASSYKLLILPGVNVVVGDPSTNTVYGNLTITLNTSEFRKIGATAAINLDPASHQAVLPALCLACTGANQIGGDPVNGNSPSSLTLGGNLYIEGQIHGYGAVVSQSNTTGISGWTDSSTESWATRYGKPNPTNSGNIFALGNTQTTGNADFSVTLYSEGATALWPAWTWTPSAPVHEPSGWTIQDKNALAGALNDIAGGSCGGGSCSGGYWNQAIPNIGEPLSGILDFGHDLNKLTTLLRNTSNGGNTGLNNGTTGRTPADISGLDSSGGDPNVSNYFSNAGINASTTLNAYQYTVLSEYAHTGDSTWLNHIIPPAVGALDPVEYYTVSSLNRYAQQAYVFNQADFGTSMRGATLGPPGSTIFQGFVYAKGGVFTSKNKFTLQGSIVSSQGSVNGSALFNPYFIYDPSFIKQYYMGPGGGNPVTIQWMVMW